MRAVVGIAVVLCACRPLPPPPMIPTHASTEPDARGTTTAMVVIGVAGEPFSPGWGVALRVERQETDRTTVGLELGGGRSIDASLVAVRGYGRYAAKNYLAVTYGLGLSVMSSGFVGYAVHGGGLLAWSNGDAEPLVGSGFYLAGPLRRGSPFGGTGPETRATPSTKLSFYMDGGLVLPIERGALSIDLGIAVPLFDADAHGIFAASIATAGIAHRPAPTN